MAAAAAASGLRIGSAVPHAELAAFAAWPDHGCKKASTHAGYVRRLRDFFADTAAVSDSAADAGAAIRSSRPYASLRPGSTLLEVVEQLKAIGGAMDRNGFLRAALKKLALFLEEQQQACSTSGVDSTGRQHSRRRLTSGASDDGCSATAAPASPAAPPATERGGGAGSSDSSSAPPAKHRYTRRAALLLPSDTLQLDDGEVSAHAVVQLKELGSGAFGRVCECAIGGGGKRKRKRAMPGLAMKVVETEDGEVMRDAEQEFRVMEQLRGLPSRFLMCGRGGGRTLDNRFIMFMDYMPGGTLLDRIRRQLPRGACGLDEDSARFYAASLVLGLEALHSQRILHRDVKPANVLIDAHGYAKLADYGLATALKSGISIESEDTTHNVVGTAQYWPPEVACLSEQDANKRGGARYGKAFDLWGLGVTLFNCVTGKGAFMPEGLDGLDSRATQDRCYEEEIYESITTYARHAKEVGPTVALWNRRQISALSEGVRSLIEQLLAPEPSQRLGMLARGGYPQLRKHKWFEGFDWAALKAGRLAAPCVAARVDAAAEAPAGVMPAVAGTRSRPKRGSPKTPTATAATAAAAAASSASAAPRSTAAAKPSKKRRRPSAVPAAAIDAGADSSDDERIPELNSPPLQLRALNSETALEIAELVHVDVKDVLWLNKWIADADSRLVRGTEVDLPFVQARWLREPRVTERLAPTEFVVERIVASKRGRKKGATLFRVKWKGFGAGSNTWEPEESFAGTRFVEEFRSRSG